MKSCLALVLLFVGADLVASIGLPAATKPTTIESDINPTANQSTQGPLEPKATISTARKGFPAPNSIIGYNACSQLMLRLVNGLIDACQAQLSDFAPRLNGSSDSVGRQQPTAIVPAILEQAANVMDAASYALADGANMYDSDTYDDDGAELSEEDWAKLFETNDPMDNKVPSTRPMDWNRKSQRKAASKKPKRKPTEDETDAATDSSADVSLQPEVDQEQATTTTTTESDEEGTELIVCLSNELDWIRKQLLELRNVLMDHNKNKNKSDDYAEIGLDLVRALNTFGRLQDERNVCDNITLSDGTISDRKSMLGLNFVRETIGVLSELQAEVACRTQVTGDNVRSSSVGREEAHIKVGVEEAGVVAIDVIKRHYAYLTQIVAAHSLIFADRKQHSGSIAI